LRAQRCEVVEAAGQVYLRYLFANGEHGAIEFERVGIMTDFEYTDDLFGEDNRTLKPTMQLIHTQNEGIINAVKNSANIRFLAKVANMLKPEDIKKERQRFTEDNLTADNDSGMIIYDNKFSELKQVESKPYTPNALQMQHIQENVCTHFGTNMDILQNKFDENTWNAYYEGKIEPFAIQLSLVMTNMSFTERERALVLTMLRNNLESHTTHLKCAYLYQQNTTQRRKCPKRTPTAQKVGCKAVEWLDELTLIAETTAENRVNKNGFAVKPEESTRTVFCNKKSVGYSEYYAFP
jgi:hypothetical protein